MESEGSSPYTQEPATCPYPESDQSSLRPPPPNLSKIHFNIILPSIPGSSNNFTILLKILKPINRLQQVSVHFEWSSGSISIFIKPTPLDVDL
jgi:hypothetical protein